MLRNIERFVARRAARIVVPSNYLKTVVAQWSIAKEKITVIPNSFEMPERIVTYEEARKLLGLNGSVIVSAGRFVPWKGFIVLIDAVAELAGKGRQLSSIIIGSGPMEKELQERISVLGVESYIRIVGQIAHEEMLAYLAAADVFVLHTGYEGFSHALLEAMAMGALVLTTAVGGNTELITNGENGFLMEYNNKGELVSAIASVLDMPVQERRRLALQAHVTAQQFTVARMVHKTAEFLKDC